MIQPEERAVLTSKIDLLKSLRDAGLDGSGGRNKETWSKLWAMAWKDAVETADGILDRLERIGIKSD